jgi:hypothetical protein
MTLEIFYGFIFPLLVIYAILLVYIWLVKIFPFWKENKHKYPVNFWSLVLTRNLKFKAFLESFSNDTDKPWFYYFVKYRFLPGAIIIIFLFYHYIFQ